jgi:hypothetical protein
VERANLAPGAIARGFVPSLRDDVAFVPVADEGVIYVEEHGALHRLDRVGAVVCSRFDGRSDLADIALELATAFAEDPVKVEADVVAFVRELGELGLLSGVRQR